MSLQLVQRFAAELPPRMADDVVGYARTIADALPEIFRDADVPFDERVGGEVVLIAGIRKLYAICSANFWILENSLSALEHGEIGRVRLGSVVYARESRPYRQLSAMLADLERILYEQNLMHFVDTRSYTDVVRELTDERR